MMQLSAMVDRKMEIRTLPEPHQFVKQRIAQAAEDLSRVGDIAKHVELVNEALCRFTYMLYMRDVDGVLANVDQRTGRLLVPAPWGSLGWKRWGLRKWEAEIMRAMLMARMDEKKRPPLFIYNPGSRSWFLNVGDYGQIDAAAHYLNRAELTIPEWRRCTAARRAHRHDVST